MGVQPDPIEFGDDCSECYDLDVTPKYKYAFYSGIAITPYWQSWGGRPANGYYRMEQDGGDPCLWGVFVSGLGTSTHEFFDPKSRVKLINAKSIGTFFDSREPNCRDYYTNQEISQPGQFFYLGWCYVSTYESVAEKVELITPLHGPDPRVDVFPMANEEIVVKFVNKQDATNIKIKFDIS